MSRSVPNMSAMMTAVMPTYVPDARPNKAQKTLTIVYELANGRTARASPEIERPPTKYHAFGMRLVSERAEPPIRPTKSNVETMDNR